MSVNVYLGLSVIVCSQGLINFAGGCSKQKSSISDIDRVEHSRINLLDRFGQIFRRSYLEYFAKSKTLDSRMITRAKV